MGERYEIRIRGRLSAALAATFDGLDVRPDGPDSVIDGPLADQAALYGVIGRLEALGLELVEVRHHSG